MKEQEKGTSLIFVIMRSFLISEVLFSIPEDKGFEMKGVMFACMVSLLAFAGTIVAAESEQEKGTSLIFVIMKSFLISEVLFSIPEDKGIEMKGVMFACMVYLLAFAGTIVAAESEQLPEAIDCNGLRITVTPVQPKNEADKRLRFAVALHNIGENDLMLNLGMMLANGKKQYPTSIALVLADEKGIVKKLALREPPVAGRVDDYIIPLSVDATHVIVVNLDQYWCPARQEFTVQLSEGTYRIVAVFIGKGAQHINLDMEGVESMTYWIGKAVSEPLEFGVGRRHLQ